MALSAACAAGAGLFACVGDSPTTTPDAAVIDAAPDGACPTATSCDPKNCGKVGHDCLGGACVAGACRPVEIATGQIHPTVIRVDGDTLYWIDIGTLTNGSCSATTDGSVMRAKVDGSQLTAIATGQKCPSDLVSATWRRPKPWARCPLAARRRGRGTRRPSSLRTNLAVTWHLPTAR